MKDLDGLNGLTSVGNLFVFHNEELTGINLINLASITYQLDVKGNRVLTDFCGIQAVIENDFTGIYNVNDNAYNPTQEDILEGKCSQ